MKEPLIILMTICLIALFGGLFSTDRRWERAMNWIAAITGILFLVILLFIYDQREEYRTQTETTITDP